MNTDPRVQRELELLQAEAAVPAAVRSQIGRDKVGMFLAVVAFVLAGMFVFG